jgi:hypothetical protein
MWGTSSPEDKLTGDLGNVIEATSIGGRRSDFFYSKKIGAGQFRTFATISAQGGPSQFGSRQPLQPEATGAVIAQGFAALHGSANGSAPRRRESSVEEESTRRVVD